MKSAAGVHTLRIPRQRGRRGVQPFVVVVPERPSLAREALGFLGRALWKGRRGLAPTGLAVLALFVTGLLHVLVWWSALVLGPLAAGPALWFWSLQRRHPARSTALAWRIFATVLATVACGWVALAAGFGPLAGPLGLMWALTWITAQTAWLVVRRTH
ncbi:membrane protein [Streptomyces albireticuli]|uniref:Membrane protein n=2 Tax=Streptomyces albireticuli TaxID=1940 RepID=A0A1Z2KYY4_9ACTN|nr:membrane protein [Streptomyces albireticuli]